MRVVYYGHELYHSTTGAQRDNHQYIARIQIGDKFRYFYDQAQLAAYNAGKTAKNAVDTAGKAIKDTVNGIKAKAIQRDLEKKGVGKINTSLGDAYKTTSWSQQVYDRQLRDNLVNNKSLRKPPAWMPGKNGPKNNQGIVSTTGKNNAPKNNQGYVGTEHPSSNNTAYKKLKQDLVDKAKHPSNQGIVSTKLNDSGNAPKNNQGYVGTSKKQNETSNAPKDNQGISGSKSKAPTVSGKPLVGGSKEFREKTGTYYDSKRISDKSFVAGAEKKMARKPSTNSVWRYNGSKNSQESSGSKKKTFEEATSELKNSVSKPKTTNLMSNAEKEANAKVHKAETSKAKQQKSIENSYYQSYIKDGHNSADARRWAKQAAENYMKKHK